MQSNNDIPKTPMMLGKDHPARPENNGERLQSIFGVEDLNFDLPPAVEVPFSVAEDHLVAENISSSCVSCMLSSKL